MVDLDLLLIGEGSLLVRCGEVLKARGYRIKAVVTTDVAVRSWADKGGIRHCQLEEIVGLAPPLEFDILFSIGNYRLIPDAVLKRAKRMSINYHYGPLPEYSGLHVPSWAIFERANAYAITWHRIDRLIDGGGILKSIAVPIEASDTALSLGLKCDEAALQSFGALIDELAEGRETETPQDLGRRRYFSRQSQFPAEGLIDWNDEAERIAALVRAADHGPFSSPLVWPKVAIDGQFLAVRKASIGAPEAGSAPGEIIGRDEPSVLRISTRTGTIRLEDLSSLEGETLSVGDVAKKNDMRPGRRLASAAEEAKAPLTKAGIAASKATPYWSERLLEYKPYRLPYALPLASDEGAASPITEKLPPLPKGEDSEISLAEYIVGAWCAFLARASGIADIHVAVAARRDEIDPDYRDLFLAWVPLLTHIDASVAVAESLKAIGDELKSVREHGFIRRDLIGRDVDIRARFQRGELTPDVMISWEKLAAYPSSQDRPALELVIHSAGAAVDFHYNPKKILRQNVARLAAQFSDWCLRLSGAMGRPLSSVSAVSEQERAVLIEEFNATRNDTTLGGYVHRLFERSARLHGSKVALLCADAELSYERLNAEANRLAHLLRHKGVSRGHLVGVCLDRSIDLVVALLAVLKTGAAYVPIDPALPAARIGRMLEVADPVLLLTPSAAPDVSLRDWSNRCLSMGAARSEAAALGVEDLDASVNSDDLAYVIFTSGSTGKPKGVEVTHGSLGNFLLSMKERPGCSEADRLLAITSISFDIAALELFLPLICGASVVVAQPKETVDGAALAELMQRHSVTMTQATPATWQLLLQSGWRGRPSLAKILCGGEALPRRLADQLLSCGEAVWNMYGPTETTVWSSAWQVRAGDDIFIGAPIANTQLYVLDANLSPVPIGFPGELCIGGAGVARGYHKDPKQTKSQFRENPFHPGVLYRTGDLACFKAPGRLSVLGRNDGQIKLMGFRIELGDIEAAITAHPEISRTVVVGRDDQLVAYCLRNATPSVDAARRQIEKAALAEWTGAWDRAYEAPVEDPSFNVSGWQNSYDGQAFANDEMRDWQKSTVDRILSYAPEHAFEIGFGSGLVLFGVAPHCRSYRAVDASKQAVDVILPRLRTLPQVTCEQRPAHELPKLAPGSVDTIIINSVAQYFPSANYLLSVIEWASQVMTQGRIFIGDVRDLSLLSVFHADIVQYRSEDGIPGDELRRRAERSRQAERELVVDPAFFADLPTLLPQIRRVEVTLRRGNYVNEMTRYRYDATLHIGEVAPSSSVPGKAAAEDWRGERLDLASLRHRLDAGTDDQLCLSNIPNGRLGDVHKRVARALDDKTNVAKTDWIDPRDLDRIAGEAGYQLAFLPSRSRDIWAFDAVFWRAGERPDLTWLPARPMERQDLARYANVPSAGAPTKPVLGRVLRPWLEARLPAYMVPHFFVELDEFPLTSNGKIDRKALPEPKRATAEAVVLPTNKIEQQILAIWSSVLGHDRIGVNDSFFTIGGNSLRVVRVQAELQKLLGRTISTATLYEFFTIKTLAAHLSGGKTGAKKAAAPDVSKRPTATANEPIAIVSMACRLPGGADSPSKFWELLDRGGDGVIEVPKDRWDAAALHDLDPDARGKSITRNGGFVTPIDLFDAPFFGISPREARALDPAQRLMLETTWEAFERAGYSMDQLRDSQTGVFIGIGKGYEEYGYMLAGLGDLDGYVGPGSAGATMSGRVSYVFGLGGPSMTVDTACSSSLVTTHLACTALRQGECDLAVAGGVTLLLSPYMHVEFSRLRGMSPDGRCKSFSSTADGTGWSEGVAVVVLQRLSDAQRDGHPILAILRGTAVNHVGHSASLTTPSAPAQERVIRQALAMSDLKPEDIDYLEAHGTGTRLGDPIEGAALASVFGGSRLNGHPLWVGSVKSNLGHTQAAAGLAGVMKTVLAMHHNKLPRTLHVAEPAPAVDWEAAQMALVLDAQPWLPNGRPRRAGVSSFGIGGTNAHVVVEEAPPAVSEAKSEVPAPPPSSLPILLSAFTMPALKAQADNLLLHLGMNIEDRFLDVAHSLATTRTHFRKRLVLFAKNKAALLDSLASFARTGETPAGALSTSGSRAEECRLALLFTGQGSQLPGMGRNLCDVYPVFKEALNEIVAHFSALERPLLDVMWAEAGSKDAALLNRTDFTQPALFALEVALWRLWDSWGVKPDLLLGHSIGELAAAHVAGVFDLADACRLVAARGRLMQALPSGGAMASLEASGAEVEAALQSLALTETVSIAGLNAPQQTVVSGDAASVEKVVAHFAQQQRRAKRLEVSHAFHSYLMDGMLAEFRAVAETIRYAPPEISLVSSLTGALAPAEEMTKPEYWVRQAREAVRFNAGMRTLYELGANTFLELGPQPVLSGMGAACLADDGPVSWMASLSPGKEDAAVVQKALAELHVLGASLNWRGYFAPFGGKRVALPNYAFQRERYWLDTQPKREVGAGLTDTGHPLLGGQVQVAGTETTMFATVVAGNDPAWVQDHVIMGAVLMPATAFLEAMRAAGNASDKNGTWDASEVFIPAPLVLAPGASARLQVTVGALSDGARSVRVYSSPESEDEEDVTWQMHAEGKLVPALAGNESSVTLPPPGAEPIDATALYKDLADLGYVFGEAFQGIRAAWHVDGEVWVRAALPESIASTASRYRLHPALLDSAMQALLFTLRLKDQAGDDVYVPIEVQRLSVWQDGLAEVWSRVTEFEMGEGEFWASLDFYDPKGRYVGRLNRLHTRRIDRAALRRAVSAGVDRFHFKMAWQPVKTPSLDAEKTWGLLCVGEVAWADDVRASLADAGIPVLDIALLNEAESLDGLICLWGSGADVIAATHELSAMALEQIQALAAADFKTPVVWVTRSAIGTGTDDHVSDLGAAPLWGLMRTARNEHADLTLRIVDLGEESGDLDVLARVLSLAGEPECAVRQGELLSPRLERAAAGGLVLPTDGAWRLEIAQKGRLDRPLSVKTLANEPLAAGEIRISVMAAGINFLDVLNALGMVEIPVLGIEFAGVVTEVGPGVKNLKVGDRALGLAGGSFGSVVVADARWAVRVPDNLSFEEAATIPMAFLTAWYGLHTLGAMKPGERILIHSAAGGVGMAAIQLAQLHGVEVYGTASEPKWPSLRAMGLDDDHIGTSRSLDFVETFGETAPGRSFDIVLNSLAREFVDASLALMRKGGRFLEMGKIDLREQAWVDEHHPGVTYRVFDIQEAGKEGIQEMLVSLAALFAEGKLKPLPIKAFSMSATSSALQFMAQAKHIGKVVLVPPRQRRLIEPDGAVLITGGVGGLGRYVAKWLATQHGVKDLVLTSRGGLKAPEASAFVAELAELGATATVVACDAADANGLAEVMKSFTPECPLRGVVHTAGVLDDGVLTAMTPERLDAVFGPKIDGAWHLHELTADRELDFFVLFSSISGVMGSPGQGNYAAANTFLDALAHHRQARGLPATAVAWGSWDGQGMAARLSEADRTRFSRRGLDALAPAEGLELFEATVMNGAPLAVAAAFNLPRLQRSMEDFGEAPALFRSLFSRLASGRSQGSSSGGADLRKLLSETAPEQHEAVLLEMVRATVAKVLEFSSPDDVDVSLPLQDIGIDSLMAVMLRNQLQDMTGLALSARIAFDHPNLRALSRFFLTKLQEQGLGVQAPVAEAAPPSSDETVSAKRMDDKVARSGCLELELQFQNAATVARHPEAVFMTGATGFAGAFVLHELLNSNVKVHCLVRASDAEHGMTRLLETLGNYGLLKPGHERLLNPVVGDASLPLLGMTEDDFNQLAEEIDAICHAAALVDWLLPVEDYLGPNVVSTHEVLRLASRGRGKAVHYLSTTSTLAKHLGYPVSPDTPEYGYMTSKWMAEQMVSAARWRGALASVYRAPFITASLSSGHFRLDRGDFLHNLMTGCIELGSFPSAEFSLRSVVPVDYLAKVVAQVMTLDVERIGNDYNFVNENAPSFDTVVQLVRSAGRRVESLPFEEWRARALQHAKSHRKSSLARIAVLLDSLTPRELELALGGRARGGNVFGGEHYPSPPMDERSVRLYVERISATLSPPARKGADAVRPLVPQPA